MLARDYKIRVFIVFACFVMLFAVVIARLFLLQIYQKEFFKILAKQQHEVEVTLTPRRAMIYDRSGKFPLAFNREMQSAFIVPDQLNEPDRVMRFLKKRYPDVYQRVKHNPDKQFLWIDRRLSPEKYEALLKQDVKDIHFISEYQRFYPVPSAAQVIGLTDIDNNGIAGVELQFSKYLGGEPSKIKLERDARSGLFYFDKHVRLQGQKGKPLRMTLDSSLQAIAYEEVKNAIAELHAAAGSVIIMDPDTGHILSMANFPSFDPNQKSVPDLETMKNKAAVECYEFGSVMKAFTALAALEEGLVGYDELIDCEQRIAYVEGVKVENPTISLNNRLKETKGMLPFYEVIKYSSNVGIAKVATRLGSKLYTHLHRLGFGTRTGIEFPGERDGFVNPPERWSRPSLIVMSFGYELMASLLQLTRAFCVVANGGYLVQPTLIVHAAEQQKRQKGSKKLYSQHALDAMKNILEGVCSKMQIPGFRVMGKTGTARCVKEGRYSNRAHNYTFVGVVEREGYRRVVATFIKEPEKAGLWASGVTLPLFKKIADRMVVHDKMHHGLVV